MASANLQESASDAAAAIVELYSDAQRCAESAGLVYVASDGPGYSRLRRGKGFSYRAPDGTTVIDAVVKDRIVRLAVPPAWRNVWICPDENGHLLATGEDDRGRKQYVYHPKWRELRDLLNSYRLIIVADRLPNIRKHVDAQLRRRTLDRDRVRASMLRIVDASGIRIGSEVYAEENESFGLTTLTRRHVDVHGPVIAFDFPAKSGKRIAIRLKDARVASVVGPLAEQRRRRLFTLDGQPITAAELNDLLAQLTEDTMTAKDFRTWRGTRAAFSYLLDHRDDDPEQAMVAAVDAAADQLHNTRAVARDHYVHPHVLATFGNGTFADYLEHSRPNRNPMLTPIERRLAGFLQVLLEAEYGRTK
ncbi:MAG TPA: DNA topoisomerase IB [Jatrophihabitantaceae bacterium]|nr:DNA topoisomerase IB [Jatrophihabitantaceae bacterium]